MPWEMCSVLLWGVESLGGPSPPSMGLIGCSPLQSETCSVEIPELEFELGMGALGGKFTTLEGLLKDIRDLVSDPGPAWRGSAPSLSLSGLAGGAGYLTVASPVLAGGEEPLHSGRQLHTQQDREAAGVHWEAAGCEFILDFPCSALVLEMLKD